MAGINRVFRNERADGESKVTVDFGAQYTALGARPRPRPWQKFCCLSGMRFYDKVVLED